MSDTTIKDDAAAASGKKLLLEMGPLAVWFGTYFFAPKFLPIPEGREIFYALGAFMAAFAASFLYSWLIEKKLSAVLMISGAIVAVSGGLTFLFQDRIFTYVKPTWINSVFAAVLIGGLLTGRLFIKLLFEQAFTLPDHAWRTLSWRFAGFFIFLAILNEVVWRWATYGQGCDPTLLKDVRCAGEPLWVNFKTFGVLPLTLVFTAAQTPFILKHQPKEQAGENAAKASESERLMNVRPDRDQNPPSQD